MTEVLRSNPAAVPADARGLRRLVDHSLWANLQWVECVYGQADPEVRPRELLGHLMVGERAWFERIEGAQRTTVMFPLLSQPELAQGFADNAESSRRLIDSRLEDVIHFRRATGEEYHARVMDIILHLITHGYHHRGQLAAHFARSGASYPNTDHINFLIRNRL
jgi:uncharacterized damage-inducible protein DinB